MRECVRVGCPRNGWSVADAVCVACGVRTELSDDVSAGRVVAPARSVTVDATQLKDAPALQQAPVRKALMCVRLGCPRQDWAVTDRTCGACGQPTEDRELDTPTPTRLPLPTGTASLGLPRQQVAPADRQLRGLQIMRATIIAVLGIVAFALGTYDRSHWVPKDAACQAMYAYTQIQGDGCSTAAAMSPLASWLVLLGVLAIIGAVVDAAAATLAQSKPNT